LVSAETYIYFASGVIPILAYFTIKVKKSILKGRVIIKPIKTLKKKHKVHKIPPK
jgi:hypothetical protein